MRCCLCFFLSSLSSRSGSYSTSLAASFCSFSWSLRRRSVLGCQHFLVRDPVKTEEREGQEKEEIGGHRDHVSGTKTHESMTMVRRDGTRWIERSERHVVGGVGTRRRGHGHGVYTGDSIGRNGDTGGGRDGGHARGAQKQDESQDDEEMCNPPLNCAVARA